MPTDYFYVLEVAANGVDAEAWVNGIPITRRGPSSGPFYGGPVNQYLVDGVNELTLVIRPGPIPSEAALGPFGPKQLVATADETAVARLARYPAGSVVGGPDAFELARIEWPTIDARVLQADADLVHHYRRRKLGWDDRRPATYPLVLTKQQRLGKLFGRWAWQDAPEVTLDDATREEILALLESVRAPLAKGDPTPYLKAQKLRLAETALAYDSPSRESLIRRGVKEDLQKPGWTLEPIDASAVDLRLCGGGKLVECMARDGRPLLRETPGPDGMRGYYPAIVGRVEGSWQIVR